MGYQCAEIANQKCDAGKFILGSFEGRVSKGQDATNKNFARRAKVGKCPCCTRATYVASLSMCKLGGNSGLNDRGPAFGMSDGP